MSVQEDKPSEDRPEEKPTEEQETAAETDAAAPPGSSPYKLGFGIAIVLVLATIVTTLAFISIWADRQILNTDQWTETSTELLESENVRDALAGYLVETLFDNIDVEAELRENLPEELQGLAGPAAGGLRQLALRGANTALDQPKVQQAWKSANRAAHQQLMLALEGGNETVSTEGGVVTINTRLLLQDVADQVGVPASLVNKLPSSVGELTVLQSDELKTAQDAKSAVKGLAWVFSLLGIALYVLAIWLAAGRRRRAVLGMGISLMVVGLLVMILHSLGRTPVVNALATTASVEPAVDDIYTISTELISNMATSLFVTGLLVIFASFLAGPYRWAISFRRGVAPYLREYLPAAIAVVAILFLVLIWWAPTMGFRTATGIVLNLILATAGFIALTLITRREFPDAQPVDLGEAGDWVKHHWGRMTGYVEERSKDISMPSFGKGDDAPTVKTTSAGPDLDKLERLKKLHDSGALTDAEFEAAKKELLG